MGEYWLAKDFRRSFHASAKLKDSSVSLCFLSTGLRYLYGIRSPGLYIVCVVCGVRSDPMVLDEPDDVPDVDDDPRLNFLRISRARSRKTMVRMCCVKRNGPSRCTRSCAVTTIEILYTSVYTRPNCFWPTSEGWSFN